MDLVLHSATKYLDGHGDLMAGILVGKKELIDRARWHTNTESHPQHRLAKRQMMGFGGMVAFDVGSVEKGRALVNGVKLISLAVSLGDTSSLIQHSASMTHASVPRERRLKAGVTDGLLRFSVGLEWIDDLLADLDQALERL